MSVNFMTNYGVYGTENLFASSTSSTNTLDQTEDTSVFTESDKNENESNTSETKSLSFFDCVGEFFKGVAKKITDNVKNLATFVKEKPVLGGFVCTVGVAATVLIGNFVALGGLPAIITGGLMTAAGIGLGIKDGIEVKEAVDEYNEAKENNSTDEEIREAIQNIGGEAFDLVGDIGMAASGAFAIKGGVTSFDAYYTSKITLQDLELYNDLGQKANIDRIEQTFDYCDDLATKGLKVCKGAAITGGASTLAEEVSNSDENTLEQIVVMLNE